MSNSSDRSKDWHLNIPLSDANMLVNQLETLDKLKEENAQLRREMDGLRNMYNDLLVVFGELRRELKGR